MRSDHKNGNVVYSITDNGIFRVEPTYLILTKRSF